jgi:hypothetical protein
MVAGNTEAVDYIYLTRKLMDQHVTSLTQKTG